MEIPEGYVQQTWRFAGKRLAKGGKLFEEWALPSGEERWYNTKESGPIGAYYTVTTTPDGKNIYTKGTYRPRYERPSDPDELRDYWSASHRAALTEHALAAKLRGAKRDGDGLSEYLDAIRRQYQKLPLPAQRAAFLANVIEEITRYKVYTKEGRGS